MWCVILVSNTESIGDTVAEWLRRSTRNRLGLSRVGSSPTGVAFCPRFMLGAKRRKTFDVPTSLLT